MRFFKRFKRRIRVRKKRVSEKHYLLHKELARGIITERVLFWNGHYGFTFNRIAIKNQKRCWGSCSLKKNLNFNYRIIFLPEALMDYVIIHELCHLAELNHSKAFWTEVGKVLPGYRDHRAHLRRMRVVPEGGYPSSVFQKMTVSEAS